MQGASGERRVLWDGGASGDIKVFRGDGSAVGEAGPGWGRCLGWGEGYLCERRRL